LAFDKKGGADEAFAQPVYPLKCRYEQSPHMRPVGYKQTAILCCHVGAVSRKQTWVLALVYWVSRPRMGLFLRKLVS